MEGETNTYSVGDGIQWNGIEKLSIGKKSISPQTSGGDETRAAGQKLYSQYYIVSTDFTNWVESGSYWSAYEKGLNRLLPINLSCSFLIDFLFTERLRSSLSPADCIPIQWWKRKIRSAPIDSFYCTGKPVLIKALHSHTRYTKNKTDVLVAVLSARVPYSHVSKPTGINSNIPWFCF